MIMRTLAVAAAIALLGTTVEAQTDVPEQRIQAAHARVAAAGIPVELLDNLVAEGRAKGVPTQRIAAAVERRANGLQRASEAMARGGRAASAAEISAGADALEAGADGRALQAVIEAARAEDGSVALAVLAELARQGVPVDRAVENVTAAMARGGDALANLPAQAAAARGRRGGEAGAAGAGRPATAGRPAAAPSGPPAGVPAGGQRPGGGNPPVTPGRP
jgi:hypothetical protein